MAMTLRIIKQSPTAAVLKAEHERDKAQALRGLRDWEARPSSQYDSPSRSALGKRKRRRANDTGTTIN